MSNRKSGRHGPSPKAVVAGVSAAIAGLLMGHERGDEILDVLGVDVEFAQADYRVPEPVGLMLGRSAGSRVCGCRIREAVAAGHLCGAPGVDGLIEAEDLARRERDRVETEALALEEQAEYDATPHHGILRSEAQRLVQAMGERGVRIPLSLLLS